MNTQRKDIIDGAIYAVEFSLLSLGATIIIFIAAYAMGLCL